MGWTQSKFDGAGRLAETGYVDANQQNVRARLTDKYSGLDMTVRDEAATAGSNADNPGRVRTIRNDAAGRISQVTEALNAVQQVTTYKCDGLNRNVRAADGNCNPLLKFDYDRWGNGWVSSYTSSTVCPSPGPATWDAPGRQSRMGGYTITNDAENRMTSATLDSKTVYQYDGDGRRVRKTICPGTGECTLTSPGASTVWYVYDAGGNLALEYGQSSLATPLSCATCYLMSDHLGSTRLMTDQDGNAVAGGCQDYLPFGEEIYATIGQRSTSCYPSTPVSGVLFTGKERDQETGLDYFGARYYSGAQGRFSSPDPVIASPLHVINPQRWNKYGYAVNNPLAFVDPDGRDAIAVNLSKLAGGMGHSAMISVHRDGNATSGEYGPRGGGKPFYPGQYTTRTLNTRIAFGSDGLPTKESFAALTSELAGDENQPSSSISFAYYKTADWETAALDAYFQAAALREQQGKTPFYAVGFNDCRDFCLTGLRTAGVDPGHYVNANISPNWIMGLLAAQADASYSGSTGEKKTRQPAKHPRPKVESKICFAGEPGCPAGQEHRQ